MSSTEPKALETAEAIGECWSAQLGADFDRESFWSRLAFPDAWALGPDEVLHRSLPRAPIS